MWCAWLEVFDAAGRLAKTLSDAVLPAGLHSQVRNGLDDCGSRGGNGIYLARLNADSGRTLTKLIRPN